MISRFVYNTSNMLRNVSVNSQINGILSVKFNSWKEGKLLPSAASFSTKRHRVDVFVSSDEEEEIVEEQHNLNESTVSKLEMDHLSHCGKIKYICSIGMFSVKENRKKLDDQLKVVKVWKDITPREICRAMKITLRDFGLLVAGVNLGPDDKIGSLQMISEPLHKNGWKLQVIRKPMKEEHVEKRVVNVKQTLSKPENLVKRPPVVTVMGHVDHGKTTLLDSLRNTFVVEQEFGGITQHIGAFSVEVKPGQKITFIDTPGHAAFTAMRARGAEVTDIVVLVIAADDGIMEQTLESIKIANAAQVPIVVAVNKIDKPTAVPIEDIKMKLLWEGVQVEDQGGDIQLVPISALKKINLDLLTEMILLQAEVMELKGDPTGLIEGVIIESKRGPAGIVATVIVKRGTLRREKILVAGKAYARVRKMVDENGKDYTEALPSTPVQILGWKELPSAGDEVREVKNEVGLSTSNGNKDEGKNKLKLEFQKQAKAVIAELERKSMMEKQEAEKGIIEEKAQELQKKHKEFKEQFQSFTSWKDRSLFFFEWRQQLLRGQKGEPETGPHLKVLLKGDVYGSLEVLMEILEAYNKQDECKLTVVNAAVGDIKPGDLEMADSFQAVIYAFNVGVNKDANEILKNKTIDIRYHNVLYKLIDDIKGELTSRIPLKDEEEVRGEAEVLENFMVTHLKKKVPVAGARCIKGQLNKDSLYRILRDGQVIYEGKLEVMRNEKVVVKTITKGMECGLLFESFADKFQPGDKIICYDVVQKAQKTTWDPGF